MNEKRREPNLMVSEENECNKCYTEGKENDTEPTELELKGQRCTGQEISDMLKVADIDGDRRIFSPYSTMDSHFSIVTSDRNEGHFVKMSSSIQ
ncbi:hypothetical protein LSH36_516g00020 [Paralvinella palmiformis]|uniref:Uncharacterized protein n=1 Tax=Paralvinella palmiformis TaxID=53620 RepID=A0AAD9J7J3_9ANNE|nr:hypothetical protein LSH36_516g00020 [Paralvinella palmiformis]